jgi:deoxyribose-phosphate aldolase
MDAAEYRRLVEEITDAVYRGTQAASGSSRCNCHTVLEEQCPDRWRWIIECGAQRIGTDGEVAPSMDSRLASFIDHTLLKPDATETQIVKLCDEARRFGFASVCINPVWVARARSLLEGTRVAVCSVAGFPLGAAVSDVKSYEARRAICDGASEVDMVIHVGALKSGNDALVARDIAAVVDACHEQGAITKVIIEAALLTDDEKVRACIKAKEAGADFVKTSTGFASGGATVEDVALMRRVVGAAMGIKAAGGIRDGEVMQKIIAAGATRIGASAGVKIVQGEKGSGKS